MINSTINVRMCQVEVAQGEINLNTLLGSCVGIGLICKHKGICGLAHCLLSESANDEHSIGAKYVDQALYSLDKLMGINAFSDIYAVLAGGANMTMQGAHKPKEMIGHLNVEAAVNELKKRKIAIAQQDTGGCVGRRLSIDCRTGEATISRIPRIEAA